MKDLRPDTHVALCHPQLGRLPGRVTEVADGRVTLALFVRPETPVQWLDSNEAELEATAGGGVIRVRGTVTAAGPGREALVEVELDEAEVVQRRDFVRVDARIPVTVRPQPQGAPIETFVTNVSGAGFALAGPSALAVGDRFRFRLRLPGDELPLEGSARVVRDTELGSKGCVFEQIDHRERELIVRFTFDRQRRDLKRGVS